MAFPQTHTCTHTHTQRHTHKKDGPCVTCTRDNVFSPGTCCNESHSRRQTRTSSCSPCSPPRSRVPGRTACRGVHTCRAPPSEDCTPSPPFPATRHSGLSHNNWGSFGRKLAGFRSRALRYTYSLPRRCCSSEPCRCDWQSSSLECGRRGR